MAITDNYNNITKVLRTDSFDDWKDKTNLILEDLIILEQSFGNWNHLRTDIGRFSDIVDNNIVSVINELDTHIDENNQSIVDILARISTSFSNIGLLDDGTYNSGEKNVYANSDIIFHDINLLDTQVELNRANIHTNKININLNSTNFVNLITKELGLVESKYEALREYSSKNGILQRTTITDDIKYLKSITEDNAESIIDNTEEFRKEFAEHDILITKNKINISRNDDKLLTYLPQIGLSSSGIYTSLNNTDDSIADDIIYLNGLISDNYNSIVDNTEEFRKTFLDVRRSIEVNKNNISHNDTKLIRYLLYIGLDEEGVYTSLNNTDNSIADDIILLKNMIQTEDNVRGIADQDIHNLIELKEIDISTNTRYITTLDNTFNSTMTSALGLGNLIYNPIDSNGHNTITDDIKYLKSIIDNEETERESNIESVYNLIALKNDIINSNINDIKDVNNIIDTMQSYTGLLSNGTYESSNINTHAVTNNIKHDIDALDIKVSSIDTDLENNRQSFSSKFISFEQRFDDRSNGLGGRIVSEGFPNPDSTVALPNYNRTPLEGDIWYTVGGKATRSTVQDESAHMTEPDVRSFYAETNKHGVIKVGDRLNISSEGVLSAEEVLHPPHPAGIHAPSPSSNDTDKVLTATGDGTIVWKDPDIATLSATEEILAAAINEMGKKIYPIGSIYTNANDDNNPSLLLGFGTWESFGRNKFLLPINPNGGSKVTGGRGMEVDLTTHGLVGGNFYNKITISNLPSHDHLFAGDSELKVNGMQNGISEQFPWTYGGACVMNDGTERDLDEFTCTREINGKRAIEWKDKTSSFSYTSHGHSYHGTSIFYNTSSRGGGEQIPNMPPYITVYMWRRVS